MMQNEPFGKGRGEEGFTLLETLVEVLLVSLALGVLAFLAVTTFDAWKRISVAAEEQVTQEIFLSAVDRAVEQIRVPFYANPDWDRELTPSKVGRTLLIPWYHGNPDALLELGSDGRRVWLRGWDADFSLDQADVGWKPMVEGGRVVGVVYESGGKSHEVRFGAVPAALVAVP